MFAKILKKFFGNQNERTLKSMAPLVVQINELEPAMQALGDDALAAKTGELRQRLKQGASLDELLPEAFAVVREASVRTLQMRHFDVQLLGGIVLHRGKIAEMKTGEGKTLVAPLAVYLNALAGGGVHLVTVNDYLARRDADWMGKLYNFLGLKVGVIVHGIDDAARKAAYAADITYGTNNEFGFDYLRDNMKFRLEDFCQREFNFAIVDEVDNILVDEARTPLIISGPADVSTELYVKVNVFLPQFKAETHYTVDEKARSVSLTEEGVALGEKLLGVENLYDPCNIEQLHHMNQALKAHVLFKRDVDYLVRDDQVIIVDEFTGRAMAGRRFSDGLHQALEAKEGVRVERENQTMASVTFQNYFRMYAKLSGMTGTADTEAVEFKNIYNLDVVVIPTHHTMVRTDHPDVIYKTVNAKYRAIINEIKELHTKGQPVLVGTISVDVSEKIAAWLKKAKIPHAVLNAKQHEKEAEIVANAGQKGRVTIATNMAGRGTDIKLGAGVIELGGLYILGTSRHDSRRIDNQLRGRSGRQGDPGSSRFFLSLEDDLLRVFGSDRIAGIMDRLGMEEDEPIEHNMISKAIENAQRKVEGHNFEIRKHLLEYDDVMNKQREIIYRQRREVLAGADIKEVVMEMITELIPGLVAEIADAGIPAQDWDWAGLEERFNALFSFPLAWDEAEKIDVKGEDLTAKLQLLVTARYTQREAEIGVENMRHLERILLLQMVDNHWKEHLLNMDHLKEGIGLRGYGQKNPLIEYKREAFDMFMTMIETMRQQTVTTLFRIRLTRDDNVEAMESRRHSRQPPLQLSHTEGEAGAGAGRRPMPMVRQEDKVGRNAPCPCGSGKKHKRCCGRQ
ncbi:MAG: preprotein translocase subunit SecA [Desulfobulbaceae bacterium]|nr:MAG: preprotein translocase subunit SecA [Desulfobulbaceae bacterium]